MEMRDNVRMRNLMYRLIMGKLYYDNHQIAARDLSSNNGVKSVCSPSNRLSHLVESGMKSEEELYQKNNVTKPRNYNPVGIGLDLEYDDDSGVYAPEPGLYVTAYVTHHKAPCRASAFSKDGKLIATGSADASIKILDIERMVVEADAKEYSQLRDFNYEMQPVIRTHCDHMNEVTCLQFHPKEAILFSGSVDTTIKLFNFGNLGAKRSYQTIQDAYPITCMSLHPNGEFLLVGTTDFVIRLYDVNTTKCYVGSFPEHHHTKGITSVDYQQNGKMFVTSSKDGQIKLWDGVNNRCVHTFTNAHDGTEVCSVKFSKNGKYVLSSGKDSVVKLWELAASRCLIAYTGAGADGVKVYNGQAVFNHTEDFVLFPDEMANSLCTWNSRNGACKLLLPLGHTRPVRCIVHSAVSPAFMTCSDDHKARLWQYRHL